MKDEEQGIEAETAFHAGSSGADPEVDQDPDQGDGPSIEREFELLNDRHLRLAADFDNYRRRVQNDLVESRARAQADLVAHLLDTLDDLQRVTLLDPATTSVEAVISGVEMVGRKLDKSLADVGVEVVDPAEARFDPATMEAVMRVPAATVEEDDRVHQVFQRGYLLRGHLIRPARVAVRKHD